MVEILNGPSFSKHKNPEKLIFMLHGYGDNADNFIHMANLIDQEDWKSHYISLNAPRVIAGSHIAYQWFDIYPNGVYITEASAKEIEYIKHEINQSVEKIIYSIKYYCDEFKLTFADCILMGFSQGGIMTFEVGNYFQKQFAGLVILSGRIIYDKQIENNILKNTPIYISHGQNDQVIPITNYYKAINFLQMNNCNFETHILSQDGHNISSEAINLLQNFIKKIL